jgi:hypothetical protein
MKKIKDGCSFALGIAASLTTAEAYMMGYYLNGKAHP